MTVRNFANLMYYLILLFSSDISSTDEPQNTTARTSVTPHSSTESVPGKTDEQTRPTVIIVVCSVIGVVLVIAVIVMVVKVTMARRKTSGLTRLGRFYILAFNSYIILLGQHSLFTELASLTHKILHDLLFLLQ